MPECTRVIKIVLSVVAMIGVVFCQGFLAQAMPAHYQVPVGTSLRFYGNGVNDIDRAKIALGDLEARYAVTRSRPVNVGAGDFTIELWLKATAADNPALAQSCGANNNWIFGNIVLDRDRFNNQGRKFGLAIAGGRLIWGVVPGGDETVFTICNTSNVLDNVWHHIALQRRADDGRLWVYVDGRLEGEADGPDGDLSYPLHVTPSVPGDPWCRGPADSWGGVCHNEPYVILGAEKHDAGETFPSYSGLLDELRFSTVLRYNEPFPRPSGPFSLDGNTAALYHFDEGSGTLIGDTSGAPGGPSNGTLSVGGTPAGPIWVDDTPFSNGVPEQASSATVISTCTASPVGLAPPESSGAPPGLPQTTTGPAMATPQTETLSTPSQVATQASVSTTSRTPETRSSAGAGQVAQPARLDQMGAVPQLEHQPDAAPTPQPPQFARLLALLSAGVALGLALAVVVRHRWS